jgi:hypothetical protein
MFVLGIGEAGKNIASLVPQISNLKAVCVDTDSVVPKKKTHEDYEKCGGTVFKKLKLPKDKDVTVVLSGAGKISAITLSLLEKIKDRNITVVFIDPDPFMLSKTQKMQNKVVFNILQQYARSGLFDSIYIFSNKNVEDFVGTAAISNMYEKINSTVANFIASLYWFENVDPIIGSIHEPKDISRIRTVSLCEVYDDKEQVFYDLNNTTETSFYYSVSENFIESEENFLTKIKERVILYKEREIDCTFGVWQNESDHSFVYSIKYTHHIQQEALD